MTDLAGGVFKDCYGRIVRVRGTKPEEGDGPHAMLIYDELVGPHEFSRLSNYAAALVPYEHPYIEKRDSVEPLMDHYDELKRSRDKWMKLANEYQILAHRRRPWLAKFAEVAGFIFLVIPHRLISRALGYRGPFS